MVKKFTIKKTSAGIRALPVNFKGKFMNFSFAIVNQFDIYNQVEAEFYDTTTSNQHLIFTLRGNPADINSAKNIMMQKIILHSDKRDYEYSDIHTSRHGEKSRTYKTYSHDEALNKTEKKVIQFLKQVNDEVKKYNSKKMIPAAKKFVKHQEAEKIILPMAHRKKTAKKKSVKRKSIHTVEGKVKAYKRKSTVKAHTRRVAGITGTPKFYDEHAAKEIELFAENDGDLYRQQRRPILINLSKKYKKGVYDISKAAKLWRYFIDSAMKKYNKEFGSRGDKWSDLLKTSDRQILAEKWAQETKDEFDAGNFTEQ